MTTTSPAGFAPAIDETARLITEHYIFPDVAEQVAALLRKRLGEGAYDVDSPQEAARLATADMQSVNGDRHLRLIFHADEVPAGQGEAAMASLQREFAGALGGVPRVQVLDGGPALLELAPILFPLEWSAQHLAAALTLVADAPALLLDLRACRGGDPRTVAFVCSYLLDGHVHLDTHCTDGDKVRKQSWTLPHVPGARFGGTKPLYVLTSGRTFSGGEELAYDLQQLGRAAIVGETTGGGAHPREGWTVHPHLEAAIPVARSLNPVSGTNWEGVGVVPDAAVPAADAQERALVMARDRLAELTASHR